MSAQDPGRAGQEFPDYLDRTRFPVDPWALTEEFFSDADLATTETLFAVGNGYLGIRATYQEGRDSVHPGTFVNGVHETWRIRHAEQAYGFAQVGQTIVTAPDATIVELYVDDEPLVLSVADLEEYRRTLDFRDGVLRRDVLWRTPTGNRVRVRTTRMVSFVQRHLAVLSYEVTSLDSRVPIAMVAKVINRQNGEEYHEAAEDGSMADPRRAEHFSGRVLHPEVHWGDEERVVLGYRCQNSGMTLAVGADHRLRTENEHEVVYEITPDLSRHVFRIQAEPGVPITLTKTVSYHSSRSEPPAELVTRVRRTLDRVLTEGVERQVEDQRQWLDAYWERSDVEVEGRPVVQQAIRWCLFQLAQAAARAEGQGIP
ncbi:MAG TPA: glycoside hydrolase family 65 protein, partial [Actinotalea sp.]|nr:glycoside hydrolase family 65 protein [Actinotalea sp.]